MPAGDGRFESLEPDLEIFAHCSASGLTQLVRDKLNILVLPESEVSSRLS